MTHPAQPLLDRYRANLAAGLSRDEAMKLAEAGKVRVKAAAYDAEKSSAGRS